MRSASPSPRSSSPVTCHTTSVSAKTTSAAVVERGAQAGLAGRGLQVEEEVTQAVGGRRRPPAGRRRRCRAARVPSARCADAAPPCAGPRRPAPARSRRARRPRSASARPPGPAPAGSAGARAGRRRPAAPPPGVGCRGCRAGWWPARRAARVSGSYMTKVEIATGTGSEPSSGDELGLALPAPALEQERPPLAEGRRRPRRGRPRPPSAMRTSRSSGMREQPASAGVEVDDVALGVGHADEVGRRPRPAPGTDAGRWWRRPAPSWPRPGRCRRWSRLAPPRPAPRRRRTPWRRRTG